jgi:hypothetical protein
MALAQNITYTANGSEGSVIVLSGLTGQKILLCFLGDKALVSKLAIAGPNDFVFDASSGSITVGVDIQPGQVLQVIYRNP